MIPSLASVAEMKHVGVRRVACDCALRYGVLPGEVTLHRLFGHNSAVIRMSISYRVNYCIYHT
jgi:hypothetical protein